MIREAGEDPDVVFDPAHDLGHRSPADVLPEDDIPRFLAFQLVDKDPIAWKKMIRTWDDFEIWEAYGMRRTSLYCALEQTETDDDAWEG